MIEKEKDYVWCGIKFIPGHNCLRSQLYQLLVDEPDDIEGEPEEFLDCVDRPKELTLKEESESGSPVISLHVFCGTKECQTIRVLGKIKKTISGDAGRFRQHTQFYRPKHS